MSADDAFLAAFDALPVGRFEGVFGGARWVGAKTAFAGGRSFKLLAEEAGGRSAISANLYRFEDGRALLNPCEMSAEEVRRFVLDLRVA
ncbi:hypothetical protein [Roseitranquillus sediminis]|uniref:hypothetical protein n=1 Tax=Roseitranquillus sediminis TaxID=2809051 RepID=UPI001D0CD1FB|nr:hypothetical protein [Roseitranquillus sediminis]MBM9593346.1 hypothetical protein [Roseitranquillus sediminis]